MRLELYFAGAKYTHYPREPCDFNGMKYLGRPLLIRFVKSDQIEGYIERCEHQVHGEKLWMKLVCNGLGKHGPVLAIES
jgi:hypothetical protein